MKKAFYIIASCWLLIILGFVVSQEFIMQTGKEVLLKTVPVDPRDLLRGDYVILNYEIAQINDNKFDYNDVVYVVLNKDENGVGHASRISNVKPSNELFLKGKIGMCDTTIPLFRTGKCVRFGIESYFVKEGTGRALERDLREGALVKVLVDEKGSAKVKSFVNKDIAK